jgi:hypothetical protein
LQNILASWQMTSESSFASRRRISIRSKRKSTKKRTYWEEKRYKIEEKVWIKKSHSRRQNARMKRITKWRLMRLISSRLRWMNRWRL